MSEPVHNKDTSIVIAADERSERLALLLGRADRKNKVMIASFFVTFGVGAAITILLLSLRFTDTIFVPIGMGIPIVLFMVVIRKYALGYMSDINEAMMLIDRIVADKQVTAIGAVIKALRSMNPKVTAAAHNALITLLTLADASIDLNLTSQSRAALRNSALDPQQQKIPRDSFKQPTNMQSLKYIEKRKPLVLALLKSYEQIGVASDVPAVERISEGMHLRGTDAEIRSAAARSLNCMRARAENLTSSKALLRAADEPPAEQSELLRSANTADGSSAQSDELLRSTNHGNNA